MKEFFEALGGLFGRGTLLAALVLGVARPAQADPAAAKPRFDHVFVIVLENHDFDEAIDPKAAPFLASLARVHGLATRYYGVSHPSLPNYLAMIGGDDFGVKDDGPSCFANDLRPDQACHEVEGESLVDQLEAAGLSFALYAQGANGPGDLSQGHPPYPGDVYAQKHIPFAYFEKIARDPARLARLKPMSELAGDLADPAAPNFAFVVPDQCHDGHGLRTSCNDPKILSFDYDATLAELVGMIRGSPAWTRNSAIVVTFDEGEYRSGPAPDPVDENRVATIVVTPCGAARVSAARYDHFALLATIEEGFGLARLRKAKEAPTMTDLFGGACP
jgi:hypothetical protein